MRCRVCGTENPENFVYCPRCGAVLPKVVSIDKNAIKGQRDAIAKAIARRTSTDKQLAPYSIFFLITVIIVTAIIGFAIILSEALKYIEANPGVTPDTRTILDSSKVGIAIATGGSVIYYACLAYIVFMLVKRLNDHFGREDELRAGILALVDSAASSTNQKTLVDFERTRMNELDTVSRGFDERRSPVFWMLLVVLIPLIANLFLISLLYSPDFSGSFTSLSALNWVVSLLTIVFTLILFYCLGKTMYAHDGRWLEFSHHARTSLSKLGFPPGSPYDVQRLPERSFVLYLVLSIITVGLFAYYWWYTLLKDPNEHFRYQWQFEDNLSATLE